LGKANKERGNITRQRYYEQIAERRKKAIVKYCWSPSAGYFADYNLVTKKTNHVLILNGMAAMFFEVASAAQAKQMMNVIKTKFLQSGGVVTTVNKTGEQWDAPNGWAPLEWLTIRGLMNYQYDDLAKDIAERWIKLNVDVYNRTGKMMEKYNVMDTHLEAGGGEYPSQDGFGWSNGVLLKLITLFGMPK
jgi:alpha,alpha-trehalase